MKQKEKLQLFTAEITECAEFLYIITGQAEIILKLETRNVQHETLSFLFFHLSSQRSLR
jgi:hypothetical protein